MAISCVFGLVACLDYKGTEIPEEDVANIRFYCSEIQPLPASTYIENYSVPMAARLGYIYADALDELGLEFSWKPSGDFTTARLAEYRKVEIGAACREFIQISSQPSNWQNRD